jgi:hypothetical protein
MSEYPDILDTGPRARGGKEARTTNCEPGWPQREKSETPPKFLPKRALWHGRTNFAPEFN